MDRRIMDDYTLSASKAHLVLTDEYAELRKEANQLERALGATAKAEKGLRRLWSEVPKTPARPPSSHARLQQSAAARQTRDGAAGYFNPKAALLAGGVAARLAGGGAFLERSAYEAGAEPCA